MLDGKHFYNQTLKKTVAVFGTIFNNIKIVRQGTGETRVPIAYGPRKKFLARIQSDSDAASDKGIAIKLPRMSFEITSFDIDTTSKLNKMNKRCLAIPGENGKANVMNQSIPYSIGMQLNIYAKNQDDALQVFEQILPTFPPEYTIAVKDMEGPGTITDVPIILNSTSFSDDYEGDFQTRRSIIYTLDFTMKVKFAGSVSEGKIIRVADTHFYADTENRAQLREANPKGEENVRVEVAFTDEPPLDDTDTITTTFGFDQRSISHESTRELLDLINGITPTDNTKDIYTAASYNSSLDFIRNTQFWGNNLKGITAMSPWNSRQNNARAGTVITPRHVLFAEHSGFNLSVGDTIYFVTRDDELITRTIVGEADHPDSGYFEADFNIAVLNEDLPNTIEVIKVLPENAWHYFESSLLSITNSDIDYTALSSSIDDQFLSFWVDQEEKGLIKRISQISNIGDDQTERPAISFTAPIGIDTNWYENAIIYDSGSPAFIVLNNEAILTTVTTGGGGGSGTFISRKSMIGEINEMITAADATASVSTGYTLTQVDLGDYKKYY